MNQLLALFVFALGALFLLSIIWLIDLLFARAVSGDYNGTVCSRENATHQVHALVTGQSRPAMLTTCLGVVPECAQLRFTITTHYGYLTGWAYGPSVSVVVLP